ncbi:hypothetical protein AD928_00855 [Acetobacter cerevisiae]|uniref:Uncharacterized protein n=1 Tax=Acetobacter cerevisiae TaxID=178900 RepID=A0A149QYU1_9PROT|nr:hypothetical protein AD928_00855 [Acetobacter cerevisiae]
MAKGGYVFARACVGFQPPLPLFSLWITLTEAAFEQCVEKVKKRGGVENHHFFFRIWYMKYRASAIFRPRSVRVGCCVLRSRIEKGAEFIRR